MSIETDVGFWKTVVNWLWAPFSALIGAVCLMVNSRLSEVERAVDKALPRADFEGYVARSDKSREEVRESVVKLFDEARSIRDKMNEQHIELLRALHELRKDRG